MQHKQLLLDIYNIDPAVALNMTAKKHEVFNKNFCIELNVCDDTSSSSSADHSEWYSSANDYSSSVNAYISIDPAVHLLESSN